MPNDVAILTIRPHRRQMSNSLLAKSFGVEIFSSLKELSSAIYDFVFSSLGQFSRSVIILLLAAGVMVGPHGNDEIPGSPS